MQGHKNGNKKGIYVRLHTINITTFAALKAHASPNAILSNALTNGIPEWYMRLDSNPRPMQNRVFAVAASCLRILSSFFFFFNRLAKVAHLSHPFAVKVNTFAHLCARLAPNSIA